MRSKQPQLLFLGVVFLYAACLSSFAGQLKELTTAKPVRTLSSAQANLSWPVRGEVLGLSGWMGQSRGRPALFLDGGLGSGHVVSLKSPSWWDTLHILYVLIMAVLAIIASLLASARLRLRLHHRVEMIQGLQRVIGGRVQDSSAIKTPLRRWTAVGFAIAVLMTSLMAFLSSRIAHQADAEELRLAHANTMLDAIWKISADLAALETSGRAYSLSGQNALLDRYEHGATNVSKDLEVLRGLTADNPEQQRRFTLLQQAATEASGFASKIVARRKLGPYSAAADAVTMEHIIHDVESQTRDMRAEERRLLKKGTESSNRDRHTTETIRSLGMILGVAFLIGAKVVILREINQNARATANIVFLNAALNLKSAALNAELDERKLIAQQLQEEKLRAESANRAKSAFLAVMSHEMRTPMNAILAMAEILSHSRLDAEQREHVNVFQRNGRSLLHLINDILDFSKIESGHFELEHAAFRLASPVEHAMEIVRQGALSKGLTISSNIAMDVPPVVAGDSNRLRQILVNLLGNAVKFTERGEISVTVHRGEGGDSPLLHFMVADQGVGIPEDRLAGIFEEFTQADTSITRKYGGTGLGLSISRRLAERMGGQLWATSTVGKGSVFQFTVALEPAELAPEQKESSDDARLANTPENPLRILVAEDNEDNRLVIRLYLQSSPHTLTFVHDGQSAVERFGAEAYDLILMDRQMPVLDGVSATRLIREIEERQGLRRTPIIALTADAGPEDIAMCEAAGFTEHLSKPISMSRLLTTIRRYSRSCEAAVTEVEAPPDEDVSALLAELAPEYLAGRGEDAQKLLQLVSERDFPQIEALAHQIKGSGSTYGFPGMTALAASLESAAKEEDSVRVGELVKELVNFIAMATEKSFA